MNRTARKKPPPDLAMRAADEMTGRKEARNPGLRKSPVSNGVINFMATGHEELVVGAALNGVFVDEVTVDYFSSQPLRDIYRVAQELNSEVNLMQATDLLCERKQLDSVRGPSRLTDLSGKWFDNPQPNTLPYAVEMLRGVRAKRQAAEIAKKLMDGELPLEDAAENLRVLCQPPDTSWDDALSEAEVTSAELHDLELTPRKKLLGDWFCEGDCGFIFAFRGVGKTWLALAIAQALGTGGKLGDWQAPEPVNVLYIDSEMPPDLMRERCGGLGGANDE